MFSTEAARRDYIPRMEEKMAKWDIYEKVSPLMGAIIQRNLLQQVYRLPGPAAVSPDAPSHSLVSAGPLQRLVTSISFFPPPPPDIISLHFVLVLLPSLSPRPILRRWDTWRDPPRILNGTTAALMSGNSNIHSRYCGKHRQKCGCDQ